jgi:hypothetical protein
MATANPLREQLSQELHQIPNGKLAEILDLVHYFRLGVQAVPERGFGLKNVIVHTNILFSKSPVRRTYHDRK